MSLFIKSLNNNLKNTIERVNPIQTIQIYSQYENGEYRSFLEQISAFIKDKQYIDIYSFFLALNSEICLNINDIEKLINITADYSSELEQNYTSLSPIDPEQKLSLFSKGIELFINTFCDNLSTIEDLKEASENNINTLLNTVNDLKKFASENNITIDDETDKNLSKTTLKLLANIKHTESIQEQNTIVADTKRASPSPKIKKAPVIQHSQKWQTLLEKISVLQELIQNERIFETAIVYDDVQNLLANFDPKEYFPDVFFPLYKNISPYIKTIHHSIDNYSNTVQWSIAKKMYSIDYNSFLEDTQSMFENTIISTPQANEHFYTSSSEKNVEYSETNKLIDNDIIHKKGDINKTPTKDTIVATKTEENDIDEIFNF